MLVGDEWYNFTHSIFKADGCKWYAFTLYTFDRLTLRPKRYVAEPLLWPERGDWPQRSDTEMPPYDIFRSSAF